jgi:hypothetical protein
MTLAAREALAPLRSNSTSPVRAFITRPWKLPSRPSRAALDTEHVRTTFGTLLVAVAVAVGVLVTAAMVLAAVTGAEEEIVAATGIGSPSA